MKKKQQFIMALVVAILPIGALAADPLQVRGMAAACSNCHGTQGIAQDGMESLAGQRQEDLVKKMMDFKTGKKPATVMHQLAKGYSDEQINQLAAYFAALKK
jgi:sulfide dehydrogenase cytochrome subunit